MRAIDWAMCCSVFGTVPVSAFAKPPEEAHMQLYGTWTAVKAERDGKAADDVVGHQLSFAGDRFQIRSKNGEPLYGGTFRLDPSTTPAAMDFEHTDGASKGTAWKGIYAMSGEMIDICDNAPNPGRGRPATFEAKTGSGPFASRSRAQRPRNRITTGRGHAGVIEEHLLGHTCLWAR